MPKNESGPIIECMYKPYVLHVVRGSRMHLGELGQVIRTPGLKIRWTRNEHGEMICDIWDLSKKHAEEMLRLGNIGDTQKDYQDCLDRTKEIYWDHIWKMPEWEIGKIRLYTPYEEKVKARNKAQLDAIPRDVLEEYVKEIKKTPKQEMRTDAGG